eukprot:5753-Pelagomonas_calceolata.AAC.3
MGDVNRFRLSAHGLKSLFQSLLAENVSPAAYYPEFWTAGQYATFCVGLIGSRFLPWFDAVCKCKFARKQLCATARRAKRAYTKCQKAEFLGRLCNKNLELHAMPFP